MSLSAKQPKPKTFRNPACRASFIPQRLGQAVCSPKCALATLEVQKAKEKKSLDLAGRRDIKERKEALKTRADHAKEAQTVMNRYVRLRDAHLGCISCNKPASWGGQWHCSHFRSVGAAAHLRFNLWNMNKSCSQCNAHLSGNIMVYRPRLVEKIGAEKVEWLECNHDLVRHEIPYLKRLKAVFTKKAKLLEARIQCNAA
ncbi:recombination protein NinG [Pseudomonas proteolytica]|uniref:Recombination protein NinG n=1 Tax=Pseudomonas proteolytica TaxID=219574 RepID=A0AAW5A929_9PSED|nr:recombination protein NinG [Pseudomonas proteolytica]MCF5059090.1 recombination protein NinG [Pseudomonas proteolytica]MCF5103309.1 recombination protein NinG [Pseudomonas proteolytica]